MRISHTRNMYLEKEVQSRREYSHASLSTKNSECFTSITHVYNKNMYNVKM